MHKLWQHPNGVYYVLYGAQLKRRVSTRSRDRRAAEKFLARLTLAPAQKTERVVRDNGSTPAIPLADATGELLLEVARAITRGVAHARIERGDREQEPGGVLRDRNNVAMVAEYFGVPPKVIQRWFKDGTLTYLDIQGVIRITREQVLECEMRHLVEATKPDEDAHHLAQTLNDPFAAGQRAAARMREDTK